MASTLQQYSISETTGFVMENPLDKLPAQFEAWNQLAADMPRLVENGTMRQHVQQLPLLDWRDLTDHRQQRLAHLQLSIIASGYVWQGGEQNAEKVLARCVAEPLCGLSEHLGLQPILTYADLILANYRPCDARKPLELDNLGAFYKLPGKEQAEWFVVIHVAIELAFAKGFQPVLAAVEGGKSGDESVVTASLMQLVGVVHDMKSNFQRMHENLSSDTFFNFMRPYASGWGGEGNPLPNGLIYEGVSDQPRTAIGGSAAQSGTIQVLDALLGVQHSADKKEFLLKMRGYMLPGHRHFIETVEQQSQDLQRMVQTSTNHELIKAFNTLLIAIGDFRGYHIQIVAKYIIQAAATKRRQENKFESLDKKGTGGTNLVPFLQDLKQTTRDHQRPLPSGSEVYSAGSSVAAAASQAD